MAQNYDPSGQSNERRPRTCWKEDFEVGTCTKFPNRQRPRFVVVVVVVVVTAPTAVDNENSSFSVQPTDKEHKYSTPVSRRTLHT
jgi:hypothetical protein